MINVRNYIKYARLEVGRNFGRGLDNARNWAKSKQRAKGEKAKIVVNFLSWCSTRSGDSPL